MNKNLDPNYIAKFYKNRKNKNLIILFLILFFVLLFFLITILRMNVGK